MHTAFHPTVAAWFKNAFGGPTAVQAQAWPAIAGNRHTLIAAPTGSGKTLAAFLAAIDALVREGLAGGLPDETRVLYVSPLKALSNDIHRNLELPLEGAREQLKSQGLSDVAIRSWVRTGDTPAGERQRMGRRPPHIVVTTPESLFILLTSESGRKMLRTVRTVIIDEIHALAGNKRGAHLAVSLERLGTLCRGNGGEPLRIGLSATQKPIEDMARFLVGSERDFTIVDTGHARERDLDIEIPSSPLEAVMSNETWEEVYDRLAELVEDHRTTLIFVNTRRLAERAAHRLAERLGEDNVTAHHGSLAREHRLEAERRLKSGQLKALVATASLELGIDIGDVDLVCQLGSPRCIATFLQRVGRSGHSVGGLPKGRLFPLTRDDLLECTALLDGVRRDELDRIPVPHQPLDVLAQHIVAEVAAEEWSEQGLFGSLRRAWPYRDLAPEDFAAVVRMLAEGFTLRRGRRGAYIHRDAVNGRLRARRGARTVALTNGGAIPDLFDYEVLLQPQNVFIGSLNEDFAFESLPGDIFQLGNTSYRILKVEQGKVHVEDAHGQPPNIPFWFGEAPGRTDELSTAVSRLRACADALLELGVDETREWLADEQKLPLSAARQLADYLATAKRTLGAVPTQGTIIFERFFDEAGDMHLVIHSPFGSRINRAWGLALRKRFCRKFNFELQAAATEDNIILSLGPTHSFPLEEVVGYLKSVSVRGILIQALLDAPLFAARWRWSANTALAVPRNRNGRRVPAQFQRSDAEDLIALVFPDQLACLENIAGDREVPDHPLVNQTIHDCLNEAMDIEGLERLLKRLEQGDVRVLFRDSTTPSPLAHEILNARPYAFLDDGAAEERRTLNVRLARAGEPVSAADIGQLDQAAVARVCAEAWPEARDKDELHDGLVLLGFMTEEEAAARPGWATLLATLAQDRRATLVTITGQSRLWVAAERLAELQAVLPDADLSPLIRPVLEGEDVSDPQDALRNLVRSRLEGLGPVRMETLATPLGLPVSQIETTLLALEQEGFAMRGRFTGDDVQWCDRRLLARIHRYTLKRLRAEVEPVGPADFMRFLFDWQRLSDKGEGSEALSTVLSQLEGLALPAASWDAHVLPARIRGYSRADLDSLCQSGRTVWWRPSPTPADAPRRATPIKVTPIALAQRGHLRYWLSLARPLDADALTGYAQKVLALLQQRGALFFDDILHESRLLEVQLEEALAELVARGFVSADGFVALRALITPSNKRPGFGRNRRRGAVSIRDAGRWALLPTVTTEGDETEHVARILLRRYGVVFRKLLERETGLPAWRELLYVYRRLEARGEIRGGRFVQPFSGEQYALPEAVAALRRVRKETPSGESMVISAVDPLNLTGIITAGTRIPATAANQILYQDGAPIAVSMAGKLRMLQELDEKTAWAAHARLLKGAAGFVDTSAAG